MNMTNKHGNNEEPPTTIINRNSGNALGIISFIFGFVSIFALAPVFVPLAVIVGVIAVINKQFAWGIIGLVCALIGFFTSPLLLGLVGIMTIGSAFMSETYKEKPVAQKSQEAKQQLSPIVAAQPKDEDSIKNSLDIIQRDFKAGPITVSTYGKCSPVMDNCESYAVLHFGDQSLKIDSVGSQFQPISQDDISWVDNRYVTIYSWAGGNCGNCAGIEVAGFDDGKLYYLGQFRDIKDGYLTQVYDVLEFGDSPVNHSLTPVWILYSKDIENKAVLDIKYTCSIAKEDYEKDKRKLLNVLATPKKLDAKSDEYWSEENVTALLLGTLALARYCGWQNESMEILKAVKTNHENLVTSDTLQVISNALSQVEPASNGATTFRSAR